MTQGQRTDFAMAWCDRMQKKYGGRVWDGRGQRRWANWYDWLQAIAIEQYECWDDVPDSPSEDDILLMQKWETGDWPKWLLTNEGGNLNDCC